jgi:hypothetical protein
VTATEHARAERGQGNDTGLGEQSLLSYFRAFAPTPEWDDVVAWPPDVFALANLILDHTESYRLVVAPPPGRSWPPLPDWAARVRAEAEAWREACTSRGCDPPPLVRDCWSLVTRDRDVTLAKVKAGEAWEATAALLTLHAIADEACADVAAFGRRELDKAFERRAWTMLQAHGSLARLTPTRVRIVPKTHFSQRGITLRSLSRYLALCYEPVAVRWRSIEPGPAAERQDYNLMLVPWPLSLAAGDFRPAPVSLLRNMDPERFGFFEFRPGPSPGSELVGSLLAAAARDGAPADAVVFPEAALEPSAIAGLERTLARHGATFLIAGVAGPPARSGFGRNYLHFGVRSTRGWDHYEQDKHHRWCLDESQIRQYHLTRSLRPNRLWWEAIDVRERTIHIVDVGAGVTTAPLVCEDLARLDEVADVIRRIGPGLVVALLLDGPQLRARWPGRYASIIADDPGSAVLTLTSFGMVARSRPPGSRRSRVIAHWNDRACGVREIELARGAAAVLVTTSGEHSSVSTADGRRHEDVPRLRLSGVQQLHPAPGR